MERDKKLDNSSWLHDEGEKLALMEPMNVSEGDGTYRELNELAFTLTSKSHSLACRLAPAIIRSIGDLVRSVNCYYSNLIEGHDTHPIDIEKALMENYSEDPQKRDLQREAVAHSAVQKWIDTEADTRSMTLIDLTRRIHRDFYLNLPEESRGAESEDGDIREKIVPGEFRAGYIQVGRHIAISPGAIPRFLLRWEEAYPRRPAALLISLGAMHHRFAWIHPFVDGNGRTSRLVAHALLREIGVGNPLWAVSRGFARNVATYKKLMQAADEPRRGAMDGRGSLSEKALIDFSFFFLERCLDQVNFMEGLIEPDHLAARIILHVKDLIAIGELDSRAEVLMRAVLLSGEVPRSDIPGIISVERRTANRIVKPLIDSGMLMADTHRSEIRINFKAAHADRWLPGLFPADAR